MCSQNDQRDVEIILSRGGWGRPPHTPTPQPPRRTPPPGTADKEGGGGLGNGPPCPFTPPPCQHLRARGLSAAVSILEQFSSRLCTRLFPSFRPFIGCERPWSDLPSRLLFGHARRSGGEAVRLACHHCPMHAPQHRRHRGRLCRVGVEAHATGGGRDARPEPLHFRAHGRGARRLDRGRGRGRKHAQGPSPRVL